MSTSHRVGEVTAPIPTLTGYVFGEKLGKGSYGTVFKACSRGSGGKDQVAIKCIYMKLLSKPACSNILEEVSILKKVQSPYIVHMRDFHWDTNYIYVILELCSMGDLNQFLVQQTSNGRTRLSEAFVRNFLQQVSLALQVLHSYKIAHLDLKPSNILVSKKNIFHSDGLFILKLADFGFASHLGGEDREDTLKGLRGTVLYMAPEILLNQPYDAQADLWSVGVMLHRILFSAFPFPSLKVQDVVTHLRGMKGPPLLPRRPKYSNECLDLLVKLLQPKPQKRISHEDYFNHPFLNLTFGPSHDSYIKGVECIQQATTFDREKSHEEAVMMYTEGLSYLVPIVNYGMPLTPETQELCLKRPELRSKVDTYMNRAEELRNKLGHLTKREERDFSLGWHECEEGERLVQEQRWGEAYVHLENGLQRVIKILGKMSDRNKDEYMDQAKDWITLAEGIKPKVNTTTKKTNVWRRVVTRSNSEPSSPTSPDKGTSSKREKTRKRPPVNKVDDWIIHSVNPGQEGKCTLQ